MKKEWIWAGMVAAAGMAVLASGQGLPPGPMPSPTVNVGPVAAAKAANPTPSAAAKNQGQKTAIGAGAASVKASGPSAYWTDLVDIDGYGVEEDTQFLFDKQRGVLYTYRQDSYQCADGSSQNGNVLMAIYTQGNTAGKPSGSGWYVVAGKRGNAAKKSPACLGAVSPPAESRRPAARQR